MKHEKMLEVICEEIDKIAEKGLTTQNLENAYKLIDMYKDLKTVEGMEEYSEDDYSGRGRRRDSMGRYARRYDDGSSYTGGYGDGYERRYMNSKRAYRNDHSMAAKQSMIADLDEYMMEMREKLREMKRDADTQEERDTIDKYVKVLDRM